MEKIIIERFENDPNGDLGCVSAEGGTWEVIVDKDGIPHFYVETNVERGDGTVDKAMFDVEDLMHDGMTIADIMLSTFGGKLDPEEEEEACEEWQGIMDKRRNGPRAPRRLRRRPAVLGDFSNMGPVLTMIEDVDDAGTRWTVSFDGPNPDDDKCVRCADKGEAIKLKGILEAMTAYRSGHAKAA